MLLGVIADDFTGASDIANTIAKGLPGQGGLKTAQFLGVPPVDAPAEIEAGVVSLKSRSIPVTDAVRQSRDALHWLQRQGCRQFVFKYCSTFDSTPEGNIGPVAEALAEMLGASGVVACPAFPSAGRTVYQGHLFVHDRLLNESGLQDHPLNPMTDADIRRWLRRQTKHPVGLVPLQLVRQRPVAIASALSTAAEMGECLVIVDALSDDDLIAIGQACTDAKLITGGSGIAVALSSNFIAAGLAEGRTSGDTPLDGPEAILAGSCSGATRGQIEHHKKAHPARAIDVDAVMRGRPIVEDVVAFLQENRGKAPLVYSSAEPGTVKRLQEQYGRECVADKLDNLFAAVANHLVANGVRRLVVAGGETSGAVMSALGLTALTIGSEIDPGVPILRAMGPVPLALALKSGNFGAPDFFSKALDRMAGK